MIPIIPINELKHIPVGSVVSIRKSNDKIYVLVDDYLSNCRNCIFHNETICDLQLCTASNRNDSKSVYFKQVYIDEINNIFNTELITAITLLNVAIDELKTLR